MANRTPKALLYFVSYSDPDFSTFSSGVITALITNPDFPKTLPFITQLQPLLKTYDEQLDLSKDGSRVQIAKKNKTRAEMIKLLRQTCYEVNYVANGNIVLLLQTGFKITESRKKSSMKKVA